VPMRPEPTTAMPRSFVVTLSSLAIRPAPASS
jgi:hypothetical protein